MSKLYYYCHVQNFAGSAETASFCWKIWFLLFLVNQLTELCQSFPSGLVPFRPAMRKRQTDRQPFSLPPSHQNLDTWVIREKQSKHFSLTKQLFIVVSFPHLYISVIKDKSKYTSLKIILKQIYKCQVKIICQSFVHFFSYFYLF